MTHTPWSTRPSKPRPLQVATPTPLAPGRRTRHFLFFRKMLMLLFYEHRKSVRVSYVSELRPTPINMTTSLQQPPSTAPSNPGSSAQPLGPLLLQRWQRRPITGRHRRYHCEQVNQEKTQERVERWILMDRLMMSKCTADGMNGQMDYDRMYR